MRQGYISVGQRERKLHLPVNILNAATDDGIIFVIRYLFQL